MDTGPIVKVGDLYCKTRFHMSPSWYGESGCLLVVSRFLSQSQRALFSESCFKQFLELTNSQISATIIHSLMMCLLHSNDKDSLRFFIKGEKATFSLSDFALITGLKCVTSPEYIDWSKQSCRLLNKYFGGIKNTKGKQVKEFLSQNEGQLGNDRDAVKLAKYYIIQHYLLGVRPDSVVDTSILNMVDHEELCENYPWGNLVFQKTINSLRAGILEVCNTSVRDPSSRYLYEGFALSFMVWAFETVPFISNYATYVGDSKYPRMLRWEAFRQPQYATLEKSFFERDKASNLNVLIPDSTEQDKYSLFQSSKRGPQDIDVGTTSQKRLRLHSMSSSCDENCNVILKHMKKVEKKMDCSLKILECKVQRFEDELVVSNITFVLFNIDEMLYAVYDEWASNPDRFNWDNFTVLGNAVYGTNRRCAISWHQVNIVFFPCLVRHGRPSQTPNHYFLCMYDLECSMLVVLDPQRGVDDVLVRQHVGRYAKIIPSLLKHKEIHKHRPTFVPDYEELEIDFKECPNLAKSISTDSGIYVLTFMDLWMRGCSLFDVHESSVTNLRRDYALNLWAHGVWKHTSGNTTPPEYVGDDYGDSNNAFCPVKLSECLKVL